MRILILPKIVRPLAAAALAVLTLLLAAGVIGKTFSLHSSRQVPEALPVVREMPPVPVKALDNVDFFTEYRLERDKIRSEKADQLRENIRTAANDDSRRKAQEEVLRLLTTKQQEAEIENLIKARGFSDSLIFIRDNSISAVVKTASLSREEVLQIADIISRTAGMKAEDITISAKP